VNILNIWHKVLPVPLLPIVIELFLVLMTSLSYSEILNLNSGASESSSITVVALVKSTN